MSLLLRIVAVLIPLFTTVLAAQVESVNLWNSGIGWLRHLSGAWYCDHKARHSAAYCGGGSNLRRVIGLHRHPVTSEHRRRKDVGAFTQDRRRRGRPDDNVVAISDSIDGSVHFLYQKNYLRVFQIDSRDDGKTFTSEKEITPVFDAFKPEYDWNVVAPGTGHGIQMKNGRLLASIWMLTEPFMQTHSRPCSGCGGDCL